MLLSYAFIKRNFEFTALVLSEEWVWLQKQERKAERRCGFIFRIDFCRNFYPEVLGTSWLPALNINILCTEPLLCKSQSSFPVQTSATCVSQRCGLLPSAARGSAWDFWKEDHLNFYLLWKCCYCFYSPLQRWAACKASPPTLYLILLQWDLKMHHRLIVMIPGLDHTLFYPCKSGNSIPCARKYWLLPRNCLSCICYRDKN